MPAGTENAVEQETTKGVRVSRLELTMEHETGTLIVGGETPSFDWAINMLQQAIRYFEDQRRIAVVDKLRQNAADRALGQAILDSVKR